MQTFSKEEYLKKAPESVRWFEEEMKRRINNPAETMEKGKDFIQAAATAYKRKGWAGVMFEWVKFLYKDSEKKITEAFRQAGIQPDCTPGCYKCCKQLVAATVAEVLLVADWIANQKRQIRRQIMRGLDKWESQYKKINLGDLDMSDLKNFEAATNHYQDCGFYCPFLGKGLCLIYHVRPMACRNYYGVGTGGRCGERDAKGSIQTFPDLNLYFTWALNKISPDMIQLCVFQMGVKTMLEAKLGRAWLDDRL